MEKAFCIEYLRGVEVIGSTIIDSLEGEIADKVLNNLSICGFGEADDFRIIEGVYKPHPTRRGAVVFTAN